MIRVLCASGDHTFLRDDDRQWRLRTAGKGDVVFSPRIIVEDWPRVVSAPARAVRDREVQLLAERVRAERGE